MTKIVLVGAGSLQFGCGTLGDIFTSEALADAEIVLNDINQAAAERTLKVGEDYIAANGLKQRLRCGHDLAAALPGADFVIISIEVGDRFALWEQDWRIPQQYGIPQVYGENGGPGGLFHALRIIPPILEICGKVAEHAPGATVFNYSNPMSRICTTVHRAYPELAFIGLCHEIGSLEQHLPPLLGCAREDLAYRAGGLNHFSCLLEVTVRGQDAYPDVRAKAPGYFSKRPGYSEYLARSRRTAERIETETFGHRPAPAPETEAVRPWSDRWLFADILERFHLLPITTDSHFGEYIPWAHDRADHRGILDFYSLYKGHLGAAEAKIDAICRERVVPIMEGMLADRGDEEPAVNLPNRGAIRQLPDWIAVEVPARIGAPGAEAVALDVPAGFAGLLTNQIGIHDLTAEAVLGRSRDLAVQALLVDPVTSRAARAGELVDLMIDEQRRWLGYLA